MLRWIVLVLLLANAGFWAWRQGWLEPLHGVVGVHPRGEREPERLAQQLNTDMIRLIPAEAASAPARGAPAPAAAPTAEPASVPLAAVAAPVCLEAGPYSLAEFPAAEANAKIALPRAAWTLREIAPVWWVALGPFADAETLQKKREELRRREVAFEQASNLPGGATYLVLSRHDNRAAAEANLAMVSGRGVRSARSLLAVPPQRTLRLPQADAAQQATLVALAGERLRGKAFASCAAGT